MELQQTVVDEWKAASADGKLTEDEVMELVIMLIQKATAKMSEPTKNLLQAVGVDLAALIQGAGEAMIRELKK